MKRSLYAALALAFALALLMSGTALAATPANDDFSSRATLAGDSGSTTGSIIGATSQTNEPVSVGLGETVWYQWTPSQSKAAVIDLTGSDFDTVVTIYKAGAGGVNTGAYGWNLV